MTEKDIDSVFAIEQSSFINPWNKLSFLNELSFKYSYNFILTRKNSLANFQIIAYLCFRKIVDEIHILKIAVNKNIRCKGMAYYLLNHCFMMISKPDITSAFLEVRQSNTAAIGLYKKTGFHIIGKEPKYYSDTGEDGILMRKKFIKEE